MLPAGLEAQRVFDDAQRQLNQMIDSCSLKGQGLVGFWRAQSDCDDINVYKDDVTVHKDTKPIATFHGLRQQVRVINSVIHSIAFHCSSVSAIHGYILPPQSSSLKLFSYYGTCPG